VLPFLRQVGELAATLVPRVTVVTIAFPKEIVVIVVMGASPSPGAILKPTPSKEAG